MITSFLLRFARTVVQNVLGKLTQQLNAVQEQAYSPMNQIVQTVVGGAWIGRGADAFVEEIQNIMMPGCDQISEGINFFSNSLNNAIDVMDQADQTVTGLVNGLSDVFKGIF